MRYLKRSFDFYINSSIHVALAVYALVRITEMYFDLPYNEPLNYVIFYGTISGYNFIKYANIARFQHRTLTPNLKIIQVFSLLSSMLLLFYASQLSWRTLALFIPFGLVTVLYSVPFNRGVDKNLRQIKSLKILIIAGVWTGVTCIIPLVNIGQEITYEMIFFVIQRFLLIVVLTLPFDIRDMRYDAKSLQTIPQLIGVGRSKWLGFALMILTMLIEFFVTPDANFKTVFSVVFVVLLVFLQHSKTNQRSYYASFWIEGIPIFWWLLLLVIVE